MKSDFYILIQIELDKLNENQRIIANNLLNNESSKFSNDNKTVYITVDSKKYIFINYVRLTCGCP